MVVYAQLNEKKRDRMLRRVARKFDEEHNPIGINLQEYISFFRFLQNISDVDVALSVYNLAEASIDKGGLNVLWFYGSMGLFKGGQSIRIFIIDLKL